MSGPITLPVPSFLLRLLGGKQGAPDDASDGAMISPPSPENVRGNLGATAPPIPSVVNPEPPAAEAPTAKPDRAALAKQFGGTAVGSGPSVDRSALAKQYGGVAVEPEAKGEPKPNWLDSLSNFASEWWKQVNPVSGVQGLAQAAAHPVETGKALAENQGMLAQKAEEAFKAGDYAAGVQHALNYLVPVLGQQTDAAGDLARQGEYAKAAGMTAGIGTNIAVPELIKGATVKVPTGGLPGKLYQSALKPSTTMPTSQVKSVIKTALDNSVPVSGEGVDKLGKLISDLSDKVTQQIQSAKPGATVNAKNVASRLTDTAKRFSKQVNPSSDLAAIADSGKEFLDTQPANIPVADAQAIKQGTYTQLKGKAYGELKGATIEAQKSLARGIKEELETQFPEIKGLNAQQAKLIDLDGVLERAVRRIDNHQLFGLGTPAAAAAGYAATGTPAGAMASGIIKMVLDQPEVKSKLAIALNRVGKGGVLISPGVARVAAYSNALGNVTPSDTRGQ
jgi:hypothetical protein